MPSSTRPVGLDHGPAGGGGGAGSAGGGQLDHVQPHDVSGADTGGPTEATNLQLLAQTEHLLKQAGDHARPGHGWRVAVDRTGPPRPAGPEGADGGEPGPAPGDGVVWTSPTGHTYRVSPEPLLDPADDPDYSPDDSPGSAVVSGGTSGGTLPAWVHRLLADVLPAWVGWPPDGRPAAGPAGRGAGADEGGSGVVWSTDWAHAVLTDLPPEPSPTPHDDHDTDHDGGEEPYLFDDLPAA